MKLMSNEPTDLIIGIRSERLISGKKWCGDQINGRNAVGLAYSLGRERMNGNEMHDLRW